MDVNARRVADFDHCEKPGDYFISEPNLAANFQKGPS